MFLEGLSSFWGDLFGGLGFGTLAITAVFLLLLKFAKGLFSLDQSQFVYETPDVKAAKLQTAAGTNVVTTTTATEVFARILPPGMMKKDRVLRVTLMGEITGHATGTVALKLRTGTTDVIDFGTLGAVASTREFMATAVLRLMTIGATGKLVGTGYEYGGFAAGTLTAKKTAAAGVTIDTTAAARINVWAQETGGGATLTLTNILIEVIG